MGRLHTSNCYITVDKAIDNKIRVLKDFCIVNKGNEEDIRRRLKLAVADDPHTHFDVVIDRVAKQLISEKVYE